ncbi:MAG: hypothetical protein WBM44_11710, partial [Waterburya sp.]
ENNLQSKYFVAQKASVTGCRGEIRSAFRPILFDNYKLKCGMRNLEYLSSYFNYSRGFAD